jgi:hypothetical protein
MERGSDAMPQQEIYFEQELSGQRIEVLKTYDSRYAREAFENMGEAAQVFLWESLRISELYDSGDLPVSDGPAKIDFLWDELAEQAREEGSLLSFFVVNEANGSMSESLYVSPDWPSAEAFAKKRIADIQRTR